MAAKKQAVPAAEPPKLPLSRQVKFGEYEVVVRIANGWDGLARRHFITLLNDDLPKDATEVQKQINQRRTNFCYCMSQSEAVYLPFEIPGLGASLRELEAAFEAYMTLPDEFLEEWAIAIAVIGSLSRTSEKPAEVMTDAEKSDPK